MGLALSQSTGTFTAACYNIHHGRGMDGVIDLARIAAVIKSRNPFICGLQEVDKATGRSGGVDQIEVIGKHVGMKAHFESAMPYDGGHYGEGLLTKGKVIKSGGFALSAPEGKEPRSAVYAQMEIDGLRFWVFSTHLDHTDDKIRGDQMAEFSKKLTSLAGNEPTIAMGDFNLRNDSPAWGDWWSDWKSTVVYPSDLSSATRRQIDYIFVRPASRWSWKNQWIDFGELASDHPPLSVELTLRSK